MDAEALKKTLDDFRKKLLGDVDNKIKGLRADISTFKKNACESGRRGRSRSPIRRSSDSWADRMERNPRESIDYNERVDFPVEDDEDGEDQEADALANVSDDRFLEVSDETAASLKVKFMQSVTNSVWAKIRAKYKPPQLAQGKTPRMDDFVRGEVSSQVKNLDRDLTRMQTFLLDPLAPLISIKETPDTELSLEDTKEAVDTAISLLGNANARMSRLRWERILQDTNKTLLPLASRDESFTEAAPELFGADFAKGQKTILSKLEPFALQRNNPNGFSRCPPPNRGEAAQEGGPEDRISHQGEEAGQTSQRRLLPSRNQINRPGHRVVQGSFLSINSKQLFNLYNSEPGTGIRGGATPTASNDGRSTATSLSKLAMHYKGSLDPSHSTGVRDRFPISTCAKESTQTPTSKSYSEIMCGGGIRETPKEGSNIPGSQSKPRGGVCIEPIPGSKTGWGTETSDKFKGSELLCTPRTFQDGRHPYPEKSPESRRLDDKARSEGCLLCHTNSKGPEEIPPLYIRGRHI